MSYKAHLFICTNRKENKTCCSQRDAESLRLSLKQWAKTELGDTVRINASGCLDRCEKGVAAVLYPQGKWFENLNTSSLEELKRALLEAVDH